MAKKMNNQTNVEWRSELEFWEEINQDSLKKELMSKMVFEGSDQHNNTISLLSEVNVDE